MKHLYSIVGSTLLSGLLFSACNGGDKVGDKNEVAKTSGPAAATEQAAKPETTPNPALSNVVMLQNNLNSIRRIAVSQANVEGDFKKLFQEMNDTQLAHSKLVEETFIGKDPDGAAILKKERELKEKLQDLARKLKDKALDQKTENDTVMLQRETQKELGEVGIAKGKIYQKLNALPEYHARQAKRLKEYNELVEKMVALVGQFSDEGKKLVEERERLKANSATAKN